MGRFVLPLAELAEPFYVIYKTFKLFKLFTFARIPKITNYTVKFCVMFMLTLVFSVHNYFQQFSTISANSGYSRILDIVVVPRNSRKRHTKAEINLNNASAHFMFRFSLG